MVLHNCIDYDHAFPGQTVRPWCFTNSSSGAWDYCVPQKCSQKLAAGGCPALQLAGPSVNTSAWSNATYAQLATPGCLSALCGLRNNPLTSAYCPNDNATTELAGISATLAALDASAAFGAALANASNSSWAEAPLSGYCKATVGEGCIANIVAPACPLVQYSQQLRR